MRSILVSVILACLSTACGSDADADGDKGSAGSAARKPDGELREVGCIDQSISALRLFDEPNMATVRDESKDHGTFTSFIDATGGGLSPTKSFVYTRFSDDGLKLVPVSDEDAFSSLDWDLAVRRYVIRLNSGISGPSDVTGARTVPDTAFEGVASVPEDLEFRTEQYLTESCDLISDGSGLEGAPGTALASFWSYSACVEMTHNVYVIALPEERHVKLEVMSYYAPSFQQTCDSTGMVTMGSNGAGNIRIRWAFLD